MPAISLGPMVSGLPKDIVQRLVDAEREPIRQLEARKKSEEAKLKLVNDLSAKVGDMASGLKDFSKLRGFRDLMPVNARPELMDVTVDKNSAEPGNYQMEILQLAGRSSMISNGLADADETQVGAGYFSYSLPNGESKEVYVDPQNSTLNGIAKIINNQKDLELQALVVNDGTGSEEAWKLIVSHKRSGENNDAEFPDFYFLDGDEDFYMENERAAQNSVLKVNGFDVEFEGNKISNLFPGVTLDLKDAAPGKEFNLAIKEDVKSIKGKVDSFMQKINDVLNFVQSQNKLDKDSDTKNTLGGDLTLQTLEFKIRQLILTPVNTEFGSIRMGDMGVQFNRNGTLDFNADVFEKKLNENFDAVAAFFVGETGEGFAYQVETAAKMLTKNDGAVNSRLEGIKRRIRDIDQQIERKEKQIASTESYLKDKFAKLEGTIAKLKSQQASVQSTMGGSSLLPG